MNIAAYCRVSTDKSDQINSLEAQKNFFKEYAAKGSHNLVRLYADEGISGTKTRNRREFLCLMADAQKGLFDMVVVKDISRFARNTVDLLQNIRTLKSLGIETTFLTANMSVLGQSEFVLTIFGALAQEESANTSKRIKFGKKVNAEKGRVPNLVYGYDKPSDTCFDMKINREEAGIIQQIYRWYTVNGYGTSKIANLLNDKGLKTKRCCRWSQNAVSRILSNELYTGKIINGKEEISDFLTGVRRQKEKSDWIVTERLDLQIIEPQQFRRAQSILLSRKKTFQAKGGRQSSLHLFSTVIKCTDCGWSFRRMVRTYKNTYIRWVCSGHNGRGADCCPNAVTIEEEELIRILEEYFTELLKPRKQFYNDIIKALSRAYASADETIYNRKELNTNLGKLRRKRQKYMDMYTDELISREELNEKLSPIKDEIHRLEKDLALLEHNLGNGIRPEELLSKTFPSLKSLTSVRDMTNEQLKQIIQKIETDKNGWVDIYLCRLDRSL